MGVSVHCFSRFRTLAETQSSASGRIVSRRHARSLAFQSVAPCDDFEFASECVPDADHGVRLKYKRREHRANLCTARGSSHFTSIWPPHSPTRITKNSILKLAGAFHWPKTSRIASGILYSHGDRFWALGESGMLSDLTRVLGSPRLYTQACTRWRRIAATCWRNCSAQRNRDLGFRERRVQHLHDGRRGAETLNHF